MGRFLIVSVIPCPFSPSSFGSPFFPGHVVDAWCCWRRQMAKMGEFEFVRFSIAPLKFHYSSSLFSLPF
jgi:hypothetical protein